LQVLSLANKADITHGIIRFAVQELKGVPLCLSCFAEMPKHIFRSARRQNVGGRDFKQSPVYWGLQSVLGLLEKRCRLPWQFNRDVLSYGLLHD